METVEEFLQVNGYASAEEALKALLEGAIFVGKEPMLILLRSNNTKKKSTVNYQSSGWLLKHGEGSLTTWKKRYFMLENDGISYFLDDQVTKGKQGEIKFEDILNIKEASEYGIELEHKSGRVYRLRAYDADAQSAWLRTFCHFTQSGIENFMTEPIKVATVKAIDVFFQFQTSALLSTQVESLDLDKLNDKVQVAQSMVSAAMKYIELGSRRIKSIAPELWLDAMRCNDFSGAAQARLIAKTQGANAELLEIATVFFNEIFQIQVRQEEEETFENVEQLIITTVAKMKKIIVENLDLYRDIVAVDEILFMQAAKIALNVVIQLEPLLLKNESSFHQAAPASSGDAKLFSIETRLRTGALLFELSRLGVSSTKLDQLAYVISNEFLLSTAQQTQSWLRGVCQKRGQYDIRNSAHGKLLITAAPEDAIRSARECVRLASILADPGTHARCCRVVVDALAIFAEEDVNKNINDNTKFSPRQLETCLAQANDCARLGNYVLELVGASSTSRDSVAASVRALLSRAHEDDIKALSESTEETLDALSEASDAAAQRAARCVEDDLLLAMAGLFSQDWEAGDAVMLTVKATLYDYLNDFNQQLDVRCFPTLLRCILDIIIASYIEQLCSPTGPAAHAANGPHPRKLHKYLTIQRDIVILDDLYRDFVSRRSEENIQQREGDQEDDALLPLRNVYSLIVELLNDPSEFPNRVVELLHEPFGRAANDVAKGVLALNPDLKRDEYESIKKECFKNPPPDLPGTIQLHDIFTKKTPHTRHSESYTTKLVHRFGQH